METGSLAPSMAFALRAAFGVRVCNSRIKSGTGSANAVGFHRRHAAMARNEHRKKEDR
jgi:hypothetical protein